MKHRSDYSSMNMLSAQARERLSDTSTPEISISADGVSGESGSGNGVSHDGVYGNAASGKSISRDGGSGDGVSDDDVSKKGIYGNEASDDFSRDDFPAGISGTVSTGPDRPSQEADDLADNQMNVLTDDLADDLLQERSEAFKEEQAHLSLTVEKLKKMERELEEKIDSIAAQAARQRIMDITVDNVKSYIEGHPQNVVN